MPRKTSTTIRISEEARVILKTLADKLGISQAAVMEIALRKLNQQETQTMNEKTILLSSDKPLQQGGAFRMGDEATIFERDGEWHYTIHGVGHNGNYYEMDDVGPFANAVAAEQAAREFYEQR